MGNKNKYWRLGSILLINKKSFSIFLSVVALILSFIVFNSNDEKSLLKYGKKTVAVVKDIKNVGGKGIIRCYYQFNVEGKYFNGFVDNDSYKIGDSIFVLYKESKPTYNRDINYIEKYYK